jgi:Rrf2 family protein
MFQLPRRIFHAVEAVLFIAYNAASDPVSGKDVAAQQGMTPRYFEQMMQQLVRGSILRSLRGPRGGYVLAREKRRITLADISRALDDEEAPESSTALGEKVIVPLVGQIYETLMQQLERITLADLCEKAASIPIPRRGEEGVDFAI